MVFQVRYLVLFLLFSVIDDCLQENWSFNWFYEVSSPWCCSLSLNLLLCCSKSTIRPCMEYCCHICRIVGPPLAASLESLVRRRNVASLKKKKKNFSGRCSSELAQLVPLPFSRGRSTMRGVDTMKCMYFIQLTKSSDFITISVKFFQQVNSNNSNFLPCDLYECK